MIKTWFARIVPMILVIMIGLTPTVTSAQQVEGNPQDMSQALDDGTGNYETGESSLDEDAVPIATAWTAFAMTTGFLFTGIWALRRRALE